jgi:16S rRNA G966 N2-methylase RsmD
MGMFYRGDNFDILLRHRKDDSLDLVCLDPPFNSSQDCSTSSGNSPKTISLSNDQESNTP